MYLVICLAFAAAFGAFLAANTAKAEISAPQINRDLTVGSVGEDVRSLQKFLNSLGYTVALSGPGSVGNETLTFGAATRGALAKFQAANGLSASGYYGAQTRAYVANKWGSSSTASLLAQIENLKKQIAALQALLNSQTGSGTPNITSVKVKSGGDEGYIDSGDAFSITFSEEIDPDSIHSNLDSGETVTGIDYSDIGGVSVSSAGKITIKGIVSFDAGSVDKAETFTSKVSLSTTGKVLTVTLTGGGEVEIDDEQLGDASQIGGTVKDVDGNKMEANNSIGKPTGSFEDDNGDDDDDDDDDNGNDPYITNIKVTDGGDEGYIDIKDAIAITFSEEIDPESINSNLEKGETVTGVTYSKTGGVSVSAAGTVTITDIATFDMGSVDEAGHFTVKLALNSTGKILTITLTSGSDIEITSEDFDSATQSGDTVEDRDGDKMNFDSDIDDPEGTFGGEDSGDDDDDDDSDGEHPYISSIKVYDGGEEDTIDVDDYITVTFSEEIDPDSINDGLEKSGTVSSVDYWETGGVSVSSAGKVTIEGIAAFEAGEVGESGDFNVKLALNSTGKILTVTLASGDDVSITDEDFSDAAQIGGVVKDIDGDEMESDSSISEPTGTFGGGSASDDDAPYISSIKVADGGDEGYIDVKDSITITFSEAIDPESVNDDLDEGDNVTGIGYSETGGVAVSSSGKVTVKGIATFDMGSVRKSGNFTSKIALSSTGKVLTITLTSGSDIEITNEDFSGAAQTGGTIEDQDGNEMESDSSINDPTGTFGGEN